MKNEELISAEDIVDEILPLLREYFVAQCQKEGSAIQMRFLNGQIVTLQVTA